jgi:NADPH:quinone reductase-like Zn-dependent oxidoreductase
VKECGADIILFYDGGPNFDFSDALNGRPIDVVIDCVGGDHYFQSACRCAYPLGAQRGRFITIVGPEPDAAKLSYASTIFKFATR